MNRLQKEALDQGLKLHERVAAMADNAFDWLFLRETLIKSGLTPFETVYTGDPMSLRYYPPPAESGIELADGSRMAVRQQRHPVPLVLVPPLGVTTETFDLLPQRSLVRYLSARGFHVYLIDWGKPEKRHAGLGLKDYAIDMFGTALAEVRAHSGVKEVSLMGWCMGGLLCLMHMGFSQDKHIRNLITVASPIDLRGGGIVARSATVLNTPAKLVRRFSSLRLHMLDPIRLHAPGWLTTLAFKMTDPVGAVTSYWDLLARLWDRDFVESHSTTADYLNNMLLYPGGVIQDMVVKMAIDNQLAAGRIEVRDRVADLTKIKANLLVFAGTSDILVPAQIARRIVEVVASRDKEFRIAPGGHMGVILGSGAPRQVWEASAQWLDERSGLDEAPAKDTAATASLRRARRSRIADDPTL